MAAPGTIGNLVAPGEDNTNRKIADLSRALQELAPSVMETIIPLITDLQEQQAALELQQDAIEAQQAELVELVNGQSVFDTSYANAGALSLTTSEATVASFTLPIPSGYTRAIVVVNGSVGVVNPLGTTSSVACRVYAEPTGGSTQWGPRRWQSATAGQDAAVYSQLYQLYTGLSGGTFTFWLNMLAASAWGATAGGGTVEAQVTYLR